MKITSVKVKGENILQNISTAILVLGILASIIILVNWLINIEAFIESGSPQLLIAVSVFCVSVLFYAVGINIANINHNIEIIKNIKTNEYKSSQRMKDDEHFDPLKD